MSKPISQAKQNERAVLNYLKDARKEETAKGNSRGWTARYIDLMTRPFSVGPKEIARDLELPYGQVAGALKRLQKQGLADITVAQRGYRGSEWACRSEIDKAAAVRLEERREELLEDHGSAAEYSDKIVANINRVRAMLDVLETHAAVAGDMLKLEKVNTHVPWDRYGPDNADELAEELGKLV